MHRVAEHEAGVIELLVSMHRAADMWIYVFLGTRCGNLLKACANSGQDVPLKSIDLPV